VVQIAKGQKTPVVDCRWSRPPGPRPYEPQFVTGLDKVVLDAHLAQGEGPGNCLDCIFAVLQHMLTSEVIIVHCSHGKHRTLPGGMGWTGKWCAVRWVRGAGPQLG
jgi:hypothetical protein